MKKLITTAILTVVASAAMAQGTVGYNNTSGTQFQTNSLGIGGNTNGNFSGAVGAYYFEVLTAPSTVTTVDQSLQQLLSGPWSDTTLIGTNTGANGRMAGSATNNFAANWAGGAQQAYVVVGWSANEGTTWAALSAKLAGATLSGNPGALVWSGGGLVGGGFVGATLGGGVNVTGNAEAGGGSQSLGAFALFNTAGASSQGTPISTQTPLWVVQVPEPTTFALAGLGAAALMVFRRRK